jgi:hypothetical protein
LCKAWIAADLGDEFGLDLPKKFALRRTAVDSVAKRAAAESA